MYKYMEDLRITKTKNRLKEAFLNLIVKCDFESISVTNICKEATISRITFYEHYKDKYELLEDIFKDMDLEALDQYKVRELENNREADPYKTISNYLYYFVKALNKRINLIVSISTHYAGYIYFAFENFFKLKFRDMLINSGINKKLKYSLDQTISFITGGVLSFIVTGVKVNKYQNFESIFYDSKDLFVSLINSEFIYE
jgi:AcrR family transcriptional regulator